MKKRILGIVVALFIFCFVGCGEQSTMGNNVESQDGSIESSEPTLEPETTSEPDIENNEDGVVDSGKLDVDAPTSEPNGGGNVLVSSTGTHSEYTELLSGSVEVWNDSYTFLNDANMARHYTYFKNVSGAVMSFVWDGVTRVGAYAGLSDNGITFMMTDENDTYRLYAWNYGPLSGEDDLMKNYDKSALMTLGVGEPIESSFKIMEDNSTSYSVIFTENMTLSNGKSYMGIAYFVDFIDIMECWQFEYYVEESIYNEDEALAVINSITRFNLEEYESKTTRND